ncbi:hypothetical protein [Hoeflea sp. TYP-13]|uniref:hypothetical protein n=1 Tax=Hoeflea sp. TYP-13 TaxID=3230023 RepID=UPI0034C6A7EA
MHIISDCQNSTRILADIGDSVAVYLELSRPVSAGVIAALAYLGPRGAEVILMNWLSRKAK